MWQQYLPLTGFVSAVGIMVVVVFMLACPESAEAASHASGFSALSCSGGELLADGPDLAIWWCEPEYKIGLTCPAPESRGRAMRISVAGNEYEPAQLVLTPRTDISSCRVTVSDLIAESGARIPASEITVRSVEYVFISSPSKGKGSVDYWPDPLPLHEAPLDLRVGRNYPFWITVHVPVGSAAGDYVGTVMISDAGVLRQVHLQVHVWGFDLPRETHLRSSFGFWDGGMRKYQNIESTDELHQVLDLYLQDFAEHRIAPYPTGGDNIKVTWTLNSEGVPQPEIDFSAFDAKARRMLEELGFNTLVLALQELGGGAGDEMHAGGICGFAPGTPEHETAFTAYVRAVQDHLEGRGWLDKACVYWYDEPKEAAFEFVRQGMELLHRAGPKLARLLTYKPVPQLYGVVDIWCPKAHDFEPEIAQERRAAGERIWWYVTDLFIDRPGTEPRVWLWQTWQRGIEGILYWATNFWNSENAYPPPDLQNPWQDPMSWQEWWSIPAGERRPWGNGPGRLFYPPNRDAPRDHGKYLEGPVPSIRWELLRDGIEDYEYFCLIRDEIEKLKRYGAPARQYEHEEKLLEMPADISADLKHFTLTPEPIHTHRARLAEAIVKLKGLRPSGQ